MVDRVSHNENRRNCALVDQFAHKTKGAKNATKKRGMAISVQGIWIMS